MGIVIALQPLLEMRCSISSKTTEFTRRDVVDLDRWSIAGRRAVVCNSDCGTFAMLHRATQLWASWGVARQGRTVLLWNCVTFRDVDGFPSMADALAATGDDPVYSRNVVRLAVAGKAHSSALGQMPARRIRPRA